MQSLTDMRGFSKLLIDWYLQNRRELPWRETTDPYRIWLSEIILQQTRVAQGLPYYFSFVQAFPTVVDLASADEQQVLKLWQGLGYYSRARNLHATAREIAGKNGQFPSTYKELLKLKGIGSYTAAAIASFAFGEAVPAVDGNVFRVLSRIFGENTDIASSAAKTVFMELAASLMPKDDPAIFNQALMEFGALQCVPKNPDCVRCVFADRCFARQHGMVDALPVKSKKNAVRKRYINYLVFRDDESRTLVNRRTGKDIWKNLYEFPVIETPDAVDFDSFGPMIESDAEILSVAEPVSVIHKLTHQHLHLSFWNIRVKGQLENAVSSDEIRKLPFPAALFNFIETAGL